jgi:hypothetical protein
MAVYVDDARHKYGRMIMCHMVADNDGELHEMAARIGVARKHHQKAGTYRSHYDVCMSMRAKAVSFGAVEIDRYGLAAILKRKRLQAARDAAKGSGDE